MVDYGTTNFEGKKYMLTQEAYWNAGTQMYQASAEDEEGRRKRLYGVFWNPRRARGRRKRRYDV